MIRLFSSPKVQKRVTPEEKPKFPTLLTVLFRVCFNKFFIFLPLYQDLRWAINLPSGLPRNIPFAIFSIKPLITAILALTFQHNQRLIKFDRKPQSQPLKPSRSIKRTVFYLWMYRWGLIKLNVSFGDDSMWGLWRKPELHKRSDCE